MNAARSRWTVRIAFLLCLVTLPMAGTGADGDSLPRHSPFLAGEMLIATDRLADPRFRETVLYMVRHDETGAFGLIVNRPLGTEPLAAFLAEVGVDATGVEGDLSLYFGGPVEPSKGFVLHSPDYAGAGTQVLSDGLSLSADPEVLKAIAAGTGPRHSRVILGYAGWGAGQLEGEMARGDWISSPADPDLIFDPDDRTKWRRARTRGGIAL